VIGPIRGTGKKKGFKTLVSCRCYERSAFSLKFIKIRPVLLADEIKSSKNTYNANFTKLKQAF